MLDCIEQELQVNAMAVADSFTSIINLISRSLKPSTLVLKDFVQEPDHLCQPESFKNTSDDV